LLRGRLRRSWHSKLLDRFPDSRRRCFPVGELGYGLDPGQAVKDRDQPLVVGADGVGELYLVREDGAAGLLGGLAGRVNGDVVVRIDRKVFHLRFSFSRFVPLRSHSSLGSARKASRIFVLAIERRWRLGERKLA
jgi:hypothetical protein